MSTQLDRINKINDNKNKISELELNIREICFEHIKDVKDIEVGDLIYVPSKKKYGFFTDLYNDNIEDMTVRANFLTKQGLVSKNVTIVKINDLEKCTDSIENIINTNFSDEDTDKEKAIIVCNEFFSNMKNK